MLNQGFSVFKWIVQRNELIITQIKLLVKHSDCRKSTRRGGASNWSRVKQLPAFEPLKWFETFCKINLHFRTYTFDEKILILSSAIGRLSFAEGQHDSYCIILLEFCWKLMRHCSKMHDPLEVYQKASFACRKFSGMVKSIPGFSEFICGIWHDHLKEGESREYKCRACDQVHLLHENSLPNCKRFSLT